MDYIQVDYDTKRLIIPSKYKTIGVQGDNQGRSLTFFIKHSPDSLTTSVGSLPTAYIAFQRPDGFSAKEKASIVNNSSLGGMVITYPIGEAITQCAGKVQIGVSLNTGYEWRTASGIFYVEKFPIGAESTVSDDLSYFNGTVATDEEVKNMINTILYS